MKENFIGGAFVVMSDTSKTDLEQMIGRGDIYEDEPIQISQTVVSGSEKDDIQIIEHENIPVVERGEQAARNIAKKIKEFRKNLIKINQRQEKIPITFGVENNLDICDVVKGFSSKVFKQLLSPKIKQIVQDVNRIDPTQWQEESSGVMKMAMTDLFKKFPSAKKFSLDPRGYLSAMEVGSVVGLDRDEQQIMNELALDPAWLDTVFAKIVPVIDNGVEVDDELRALVEEAGHKFSKLSGMHLQSKNPEAGSIQRFIHVANEWDLRNQILRVPELRDIFVKIFMKECNFKHNICLKPSWAEANPPFSDVVSTFLADNMDKRDGTSPTSITIHKP